ncbi:MAG: peptidoglycan DD-metalloendopeptidase family protein, partial [Desulfobacteraceae bacterium]|nr:peptidoglycan DD-metalloendopeptidase family protein [Desulfobacteraceae bacterium]
KIAMIRPDSKGNEQIYYFINNMQGSPIYIVDAEGTKISKVQMDEWGNAGLVVGPVTELNFTGKKLEPESKLFYFNQRWYDSETGRFLTEDPAAQGPNPYAYCANNPISYVDPDGEFFFEIFTFVGGLIGGAYEYIRTGGDGNAFAKGFMDGAKIGGTIGIGLDLYTGGITTYSDDNPFFKAALSTYTMAWYGQAGTSVGVPIGGGGPEQQRGMGGGETNNSRYEDPGIYLPGSGPGQGNRPGSGSRTSPYQSFREWDGKPHLGNDFGYGDGNVYARYSGRVTYAQMWNNSGFGNQIRVQRSGYSGQYSSYSHLSSMSVSRGDFVLAGQNIGRIGGTSGRRGVSYTPHLHYAEYTIDPDGKWRYWDPGY